MNTISWYFAVFVLAAWLLVRYVVPARHRHGVMTAGAVYFVVMQSSPLALLRLLFIVLTFLILAIGWRFGRRLAQTPEADRTAALKRGVIWLLSPLVLFKLIQTILPVRYLDMIFSQRGHVDLGSLAPLGISYFTFRALAYLIEIRRGALEPVGWWRYVNYVAFWPTLPAGPIERPAAFLSQTAAPTTPTVEDLRVGFLRLVAGLGKKLALGAFFYQLAKPYLLMQGGAARLYSPSDWPVWQLWLCLHAYYFYLYFDFAGYSDIAIGVARLFGYRILENFRWPILATNVADFWRRWHMSLTGWITDYVYVPLGGNRAGLKAAAHNTIIAMVLVGVWHGFNPHFAVWGLYHAAWLILYRQYRKKWAKPAAGPKPWWRRAAAWFVTFEIVNLGWVLFVFKVKTALAVYARLFFLS
jgi:alginate O-acetyltransferase complex protein AlgI